ncbi:MAG: YigZ family protein [Spirochaetales bacterium]|nr:YigZ family protein [Spirochaetales bacterium]
MFVPKAPAEAEITVKASRFLSRIELLSSQEEVKNRVARLRVSHPGAAHVVWAYIWGRERSVFGYSDDREPKGTAGRPAFEVLKGSGLTNTLLTIVRYFGGTKLGTGGLVRAYTDAAKEVLACTVSVEDVAMKRMELTVDYSAYERIHKRLAEFGGKIHHEQFDADVCLQVDVPESEALGWRHDVMDITAGRATIQETIQERLQEEQEDYI